MLAQQPAAATYSALAEDIATDCMSIVNESCESAGISDLDSDQTATIFHINYHGSDKMIEKQCNLCEEMKQDSVEILEWLGVFGNSALGLMTVL
ncbi:hypothetical protein Tco_1548042 [Tanacetum coccineum]